MTIIYHEDAADLNDLAGNRIGIIGYGRMGRPTALNLRDSGLPVLVCDQRADKRSLAIAEGFEIASTEQVVQMCDILLLLYRDEIMPQIYLEQVSPHLRRGQSLIFSSAYNVTFGFIEPPTFVDVGLVAACTSGEAMRERFLRGAGFASLVAVHQDSTGHAWKIVLALALALGALRGGAVEVRLEQEAELDLFFQQAVMPALYHLLITAANVLVREGFEPEAALTQLYLSGETADFFERIARYGILNTLKRGGLTAQYSTLSRIDRFNDLKLDYLMEMTLREIRDGRFAQEWAKEYSNDYPRLKQLLKARERMELWEMERDTMDMLHVEEEDPHAPYRPPVDDADEGVY